MTPSTAHPVVHFEIGCKDRAATTTFYTGNMVGLVTK